MYLADDYIANPTHNLEVASVGVGATGSFILPELASISNMLQMLDRKPLDIVVFDPDKIEPHNVNKQKYHDADIGDYKAEILTSRVNRAYGMGIKSENRYFDAVDVKDSFNIIVSCVDDVRTREYIDQAIKRLEDNYNHNNSHRTYSEIYHWIDCGNSKDYGQIILSAHHERKLPTIIDVHPDIEEDKNEPSCSLRESLNQQSFIVNKMTGILAIEMLSSLLFDFNILHSQVYFNLNPLTIKTNSL